MRIFFLVLVLANLAFAAWHAWFSGADLPTRPIRPGGPGIEIYQSATGTVPDTAASAAPAESTAQRECVSVGPFPNRVDVEDAVSALTASGFQAQQRAAQGEVWLGYWVYIDAIETQTEAARIVERLGAEGINEAYVIADGDNGNIISLGVFSERARATQRFSDVEALGLAPVVVNRSQPGEVFWLDVTARSGRAFDRSELPVIEVDPELQFAVCAGGGE
ncbi:MAG: hypothetical protein PVF63_04355 [Gammaproteobacteria bacterium]|jgi:cell division septation protein DedD